MVIPAVAAGPRNNEGENKMADMTLDELTSRRLWLVEEADRAASDPDRQDEIHSYLDEAAQLDAEIASRSGEQPPPTRPRSGGTGGGTNEGEA